MNLSIFGNRTIQFMKKFLLFSSLIICCAPIRSQVTFTDSNLPIMVVNTLGGTIVDEPKIKAELGVIDNGPGQRNHLTDPHNGYDGFIGIEIRGSSSQSFPKRVTAWKPGTPPARTLTLPCWAYPKKATGCCTARTAINP